jgi:hypothetical protein
VVSSTTEVSSTFPALAYARRGQKYAKITAAIGTTSLVAAVTGTKIRVLALVLTQEPNAAGSVTFKSASTAITGEMLTLTVPHHLVLPFSPAGWFETAAGEALQITAVGTIANGTLVYDEVSD